MMYRDKILLRDVMSRHLPMNSDVNKDSGHKAKAKAKDSSLKAKAKAKDSSRKAKTKAKDLTKVSKAKAKDLQ